MASTLRMILGPLLPATVLMAPGVAGLLLEGGKKLTWQLFAPMAVAGITSTAAIDLCFGTDPRLQAHEHSHVRRLSIITSVFLSVIWPLLVCTGGRAFGASLLDWVSTAGGVVSLVAALHLYVAFFIQAAAASPALAKMRSIPYCVLISWPATICSSASIFSIPLLPWCSFLGPDVAFLVLVPVGLAVVGVVQCILPVPDANRWERVALTVGPGVDDVGGDTTRLRRDSCRPSPAGDALRIVQITDPHLGPFMSVCSLQKICEETVKLNPDLVMLTGDFFTPESDHTEGVLEEALGPLSRLQGKCFACLGNHDVEREDVLAATRRGLEAVGATLLVDESADVATSVGDVRVCGLNWAGKGISNEGTAALQALQGSQRAVVLLHNPEALKECSEAAGAAAPLVLCGHSHGGLLGLVSVGFNLTLLSILGMLDHSLWGVGRSRGYVHRAQGFRALSCNWVARVGVPPEYSVLEVTYV